MCVFVREAAEAEIKVDALLLTVNVINCQILERLLHSSEVVLPLQLRRKHSGSRVFVS